ncbi:hypothetical protein ElyMa_005975700 [Elysia marginata]|uniref:Uncharacterized protein n=1 Tax=Elysia marginata TaxID=1093978 RepID=A0AAV4GCI7_9GAST|nr:hypothetical protein ElyMa_005975700 [Elysia marginata]
MVSILADSPQVSGGMVSLLADSPHVSGGMVSLLAESPQVSGGISTVFSQRPLERDDATSQWWDFHSFFSQLVHKSDVPIFRLHRKYKGKEESLNLDFGGTCQWPQHKYLYPLEMLNNRRGWTAGGHAIVLPTMQYGPRLVAAPVTASIPSGIYDSDDAGRNDDYGGIDTDDDGGIDTDDDGGNVTDDDSGNDTDDDDDGGDSGPPLGSISEPELQERAALQVQGFRAAEVCGPPRPTYDQSLETTHIRVSNRIQR